MTIPEVSAQRAVELTDEGALLLDVREDEEWAVGHAPQAVHRPLSRLTAEDVPLDRPVVAVCRSGGRSGQLTALLAPRGVDIVNLTGGMSAWHAAGLPVVCDDGSHGEVL
jgi:rhodanese-related sulfurtransferase